MLESSPDLPRRNVRSTSRRLSRVWDLAPRLLPLLGLAALVLALLAVILEGAAVAASGVLERILRGALFVLSCFVGAYMPVDGQPQTPSLLSTTALVLALLTSLGGVALAVLRVFAREIELRTVLLRRGRLVIIGDSAPGRAFATRVKDSGRVLATVWDDEAAMIRITGRDDIARDSRVRRAVRGARAVYVLHESSVDGALTAAEVRSMRRSPQTFQMFDWEQDRLVFRPAISDGAFPQIEVFSPIEITGIHLAHVIAHLVRIRRKVLRVELQGDHQVLDIVRERLTFMKGTLAFRGAVEFVDDGDTADVTVIGVPQHSYLSAVSEALGDDKIVFSIAPERYFMAVGRSDLGAVASRDWLADRDDQGVITSPARVVVVDETRIGYDIDEVSLGVRTRWAREFHNAHSDFGTRWTPGRGDANRWLDRPPHPRLVTMAEAAVDLMLSNLHRLGYFLAVRPGEHDELADSEVEDCARLIHEQYLTLTWLDSDGEQRRCARYFVAADATLHPTEEPPRWDEDSEDGRERNRAMVREVYPALAAIFGYRITRRV